MNILLIPGDGIGPEVIGAAAEILRAAAPAAQISEAPAGWEVFIATGTALPAATLAAAHAADAILFGAVASPSYPVPGYHSPIIALRRALDLYANMRPTRTPPLPGARPGVDLLVVRENTEGLYAGRERSEDGGDTAIAERVITRHASTRIAQAAVAAARQRAGAGKRPRVTIVHKANVLRTSCGLFRAAALAVLADAHDVDHDELLVDVAAMHLTAQPERFDVLVTTNLFGDILSDVACIHGGGLGLASSANIGDQHALFEPVHGAALDIAGRGVANPLAAISCAGHLLARLGQHAAAQRIAQAVEMILRDGPRTPDLGGNAGTADVVRAVARRVCRSIP